MFQPIGLGGGDALRVRDLTTGAAADVVFYERDGLDASVKNTTGTFSLGNDFETILRLNS